MKPSFQSAEIVWRYHFPFHWLCWQFSGNETVLSIGLEILLFVYFFLFLPVIAHSLSFHEKDSTKTCIRFQFFSFVLHKSASINFSLGKTFSASHDSCSTLKRWYFFRFLLLSNLHSLSKRLSIIPWTVLNF